MLLSNFFGRKGLLSMVALTLPLFSVNAFAANCKAVIGTVSGTGGSPFVEGTEVTVPPGSVVGTTFTWSAIGPGGTVSVSSIATNSTKFTVPHLNASNSGAVTVTLKMSGGCTSHQNESASTNISVKNAACTVASGTTQSWSVGGNTCSVVASASTTTQGNAVSFTDPASTYPDNAGSVSFQCQSNGSFGTTLVQQSGATCAPVPKAPCAVANASRTWTVGGNVCSDTLKNNAAAISSDVVQLFDDADNNNTANIGQANYMCNNGVLSASPESGATCAPPAPVCEVIANISPDNQTVPERDINGDFTNVKLNATASKPNNASFFWHQVSGPAVVLSSATAAQPTFDAPSVPVEGAALVFEVAVTGCTPSDTKTLQTTVNITDVNLAPAASAVVTPDVGVFEGDLVTLDGSSSSDPDGDALTYQWTQIAGTTMVTLSNPNGAITTFTAPNTAYPSGASFQFQLTVSDGALNASTQPVVNVIWLNDAPTAIVACTADVNEGGDITLDGTSSYDPEGTTLTYDWSLVTGPPTVNVSVSHLALNHQIAPQLGLGQVGDMPFVLTVTDAGGLFHTTGCTVFVHDITKPTISGAHDLLGIEATTSAGAPVTFPDITASDLVDGDGLAVTCTRWLNNADTAVSSGATFVLGTTKVTCSASDTAGNKASVEFNVEVVDTTAPSILNANDVNAEATSADGAIVTFDPEVTAWDAYDGALAATCTPATGSQFGFGVTPVHCSATDAAGKMGSADFSVTVKDSTAPVLTVPADILEEITAPGGNVISFTATATDAVDPSPVVTCAPASGSTFGLGNTVVSCSAKDASNNTSAEQSFNVTVQDTIAPTLEVPGDMTVEATSAAGALANFSATASDAGDASPVVTCNPASGSTFAIGTTLVSCTATDATGNTSAPQTFNVTVQDTTAPALTVPGDITEEAGSASGNVITFLATATDAVDASPVVTCTPASGSTFAITTTSVSCTATDATGNISAAKTFNVTVQDTTAPELTVPGDITEEAGSASGNVVTFLATASDVVDAAPVVTCAPASGSTFAITTTLVSCTATDATGNTSAAKTFNVTVQDTTAPVISAHANVTDEATSASGASVSYSLPTASDLVDGAFAATCSPVSGSTFAIGVSTVTCNAQDAAGNHAESTSFTVTVQDTTAPAIVLGVNGLNIGTYEATGPSGAQVSFTNPTWTDAVDGAGTTICSPISGSTFALGTSTVHCTATDAHGNAASVNLSVFVQDTTPPAISAHADVNVKATSAAGAVVTYTLPTASDLVSGSVTVTCTPASGSTFALGNKTVNCTATDGRGNVGSSSFNVSVTYTWSGFLQPVDNLPTVNAVKAGSAIPVKFTLGANMGLSIFAFGYPKQIAYACNGTAEDAIEETVTAGGSSLSYDAVTGKYNYVWKSDKSWVGTCRQLQIKLADGTTQVANFSFK